MIICIEGPSAVGKTTTCKALVERTDAVRIPEVNELFTRPANASSTWYLERQVDRMRVAVEEAEHHAIVLLDGDPFQPLWYNWTYHFEHWQGLDELSAFYGRCIRSGEMRLPDRYILLRANEPVLRLRKEGDPLRSRHGFETHLRLIPALDRYFRAMSDRRPDFVSFIEATSIEACVQAIVDVTRSNAAAHVDDVALFDQMVVWLDGNIA